MKILIRQDEIFDEFFNAKQEGLSPWKRGKTLITCKNIYPTNSVLSLR
jgi:hypothetical protein